MTHLKRRHGTHTHNSLFRRWRCLVHFYILFSFSSLFCVVLCTMYLIKSSLLHYVYLDDDACIHIIIIINVIIIVVPHFTTTHKIYMSNIYFVRGDLMLVLIYCAHVPLCVGVLFVCLCVCIRAFIVIIRRIIIIPTVKTNFGVENGKNEWMNGRLDVEW